MLLPMQQTFWPAIMAIHSDGKRAISRHTSLGLRWQRTAIIPFRSNMSRVGQELMIQISRSAPAMPPSLAPLLSPAFSHAAYNIANKFGHASGCQQAPLLSPAFSHAAYNIANKFGHASGCQQAPLLSPAFSHAAYNIASKFGHASGCQQAPLVSPAISHAAYNIANKLYKLHVRTCIRLPTSRKSAARPWHTWRSASACFHFFLLSRQRSMVIPCLFWNLIPPADCQTPADMST